MTAEMTEPEWDSQDSSTYHDGYEHGEADARAGRHLALAVRDGMSRTWREGYEDGHADMEAGQ